MYTILAIDQITKHTNAQRDHQTVCVRNFENINNEDLDILKKSPEKDTMNNI